MTAKLAHIAIEADDVDRAIGFYETVFGWAFTPWGPPNFFHIKGAGVHGALQQRQSPMPDGRKGIECTFAVRNLQDTMDLVKSAGGVIAAEPFEIKTIGTLVPIEDTEGNRLIVMEYAPAYASEIGIDTDGL